MPILRCLILLNAAANFASAEELPAISVKSEDGKSIALADDKLYEFESDLRKRLAADDGPTEIVVLARSSPIEFRILPRGGKDNIREILVLSFSMNEGKAEWTTDYGQQRHTSRLSLDQIKSVREFLAANSVDKLPPLKGSRGDWSVVDGVQYVFVHLKADQSRRVEINNPDIAPDDPHAQKTAQKYDQVVKFLQQFAKGDETKAE